MRFAKSFRPYDGAQYARPWIAKVVAWQVGKRAELAWGTYLGDDNGGEAEIEAAPGDVVLFGQKGRAGRAGFAVYGTLEADGSFKSCTEAAAARRFRESRSFLGHAVAVR
jgi:hypothetical protein